MSVIKLKRVEKAIRRICNYLCCSLSSGCLFRCMPHTEMLPRDANGPFQLAKCFLSYLLFKYSMLIEFFFFIVSLENKMRYSVVAFIFYKTFSNWVVYCRGSSKSSVALFCSILFLFYMKSLRGKYETKFHPTHSQFFFVKIRKESVHFLANCNCSHVRPQIDDRKSRANE